MDSFHSMVLQCARLKVLAIKKRDKVMHIARIGVDLAKQVFQIHGVDRTEKVLVRRQLRRRRCWIISAHAAIPDWHGGMRVRVTRARELSKLGHEVRLMAPQFVKPDVKSGKNDANDAEAICEAVGRPNSRLLRRNTASVPG
jgi:transposase